MTSLHPDIVEQSGEMPRRRMTDIPRGLNDGVIYPEVKQTFWTRTVAMVREMTGLPEEAPANITEEPAEAKGEYRVAVVLVEFDGATFAAPRDELVRRYQTLFFAASGNSVRTYYGKASRGKVDITGEVFGPYKMAHTEDHYANGKSGTGKAVPNGATLAEEAAKAAVADGKKFLSFDGRNRSGPDGFVDGFVVVHAGPGAEHIADPSVRSRHLESHKSVLKNQLSVDGGRKICAYAVVAKDSPLGVICHELGHLLFQLPDLYPSDLSHAGGVGKWCLMGTGNWNGPNDNGTRPAHLSAWCKYKLGWAKEVNIDGEREVHLKDVKDSGEVVRLWLKGKPGKEFFLVENRSENANTFDDGLPGRGLLIWHIDESQPSNDEAVHPKVCLKQADGEVDLQKPGVPRKKWGDPGDPYTRAGQTFALGTEPSSRSYAGLPSGVNVVVLTGAALVMAFRAKVDDLPIA